MNLLKFRELRESLKLGLGSLPAPRNDFEIVIPDADDMVVEDGDGDATRHWVADQADLDHQSEEERRRRRDAELRLRSQAVRRDLPRPVDMNHTVLRPLNSDQPLTDLQRAEELIKREMILMLHHDCLETPTPAQVQTDFHDVFFVCNPKLYPIFLRPKNQDGRG